MYEERVAIIDLADELQVRKQRIFKLLQRLGSHATQRREPERGNQNVATVSLAETAAIRQELASYGYGCTSMRCEFPEPPVEASGTHSDEHLYLASLSTIRPASGGFYASSRPERCIFAGLHLEVTRTHAV